MLSDQITQRIEKSMKFDVTDYDSSVLMIVNDRVDSKFYVLRPDADHSLNENYMFSNRIKRSNNAALQVINE